MIVHLYKNNCPKNIYMDFFFFLHPCYRVPFSQLHPAHCGPGKELKTIPPYIFSFSPLTSMQPFLSPHSELQETVAASRPSLAHSPSTSHNHQSSYFANGRLHDKEPSLLTISETNPHKHQPSHFPNGVVGPQRTHASYSSAAVEQTRAHRRDASSRAAIGGSSINGIGHFGAFSSPSEGLGRSTHSTPSLAVSPTSAGRSPTTSSMAISIASFAGGRSANDSPPNSWNESGKPFAASTFSRCWPWCHHHEQTASRSKSPAKVAAAGAVRPTIASNKLRWLCVLMLLFVSLIFALTWFSFSTSQHRADGGAVISPNVATQHAAAAQPTLLALPLLAHMEPNTQSLLVPHLPPRCRLFK